MRIPDRDLREILGHYLVANGWQRGALADEWTQRDFFVANVSLGMAIKKQLAFEDDQPFKEAS